MKSLNIDTRINQSSRIAFITSQAFSIINFRAPLISEMVKKGLTVYALAPDYNENTRSKVASLGAYPIDIHMSRTGMNPILDTLNMLRLVIVLKRLDIDMSFAYFIKPVIYGSLAARLANIPRRFAMIEGAGYVFTDSKKTSLHRKFLRVLVSQLYKLGLSQVQYVFMLNKDDKKLFVESKMVDLPKIYLIDGIGLDLECYKTQSVKLSQPCFILIARLLREKGIYDYIEAIRFVKINHPNIRFLLLGNIDFNPSSILESEVKSWVKEGLVEWPGHVEDVRFWIEQADVFILPSYREGLPRSTQEAMAMGRAIITTDVPGCRETVVDGLNGFLVTVRNSKALAEAMLRFIDNPLLASKMGEESLKMAKKRFNVHKINAEILEVMGIVIG